MTLEEVLDRVDQHANRNDPDYVDNRLEFVRSGHRYVERKYHGKEALYGKWDTTEPLPLGVGVVPLPACYRASAELRVYLLPQVDELVKIRPQWLDQPFMHQGETVDLRASAALGRPRFFAVWGRSLQLRPLPPAPLEVRITGTGWADPLTNPGDETVISQEAPDALIYASLMACWLFMGDDPQKVFWQAEADKAIDEWMKDRIAEEEIPVLYMEVPG